MAVIQSGRCARLGVTLGCALTFLSPGVLAQDGSPQSPTWTVPTVDLSSVGGKGEGRLDLIARPGYAEDGTNLPEYDWINGFTDATGCRVRVTTGVSSDEILKETRTGAYDGVSAPGDVALALIAAGDVAESTTSTIPDFPDVLPFLQDAPHYVVDGKHYGVPQGWAANTLMYNTDLVAPAPTSSDVLFGSSTAAPYVGRITVYDSPISIADAALYLKAHQPSLGITDIYELSSDQLDAAVTLLEAQAALVGQYWSKAGVEIANFANATSAVGTAWPYQITTLAAAGLPVASVTPAEGVTGWADTWMMSTKAAHPNCMLKWMAWMLTPQIQAQVAEYFGEAPTNSKACQYLDAGYGTYQIPDFCDKYGVSDPVLHDGMSMWKTPQSSCGDDRGDTCADYELWTKRWTEIRGV